MTTVTNPKTGATVTVPDDVAESYTSRGWVRPGMPAPAEQGLDAMTVAELRAHADAQDIDLGSAKRKADIRAAIEAATQEE